MWAPPSQQRRVVMMSEVHYIPDTDSYYYSISSTASTDGWSGSFWSAAKLQWCPINSGKFFYWFQPDQSSLDCNYGPCPGMKLRVWMLVDGTRTLVVWLCVQFRPGGPPQPGQQFMPPGAQQYRPGGGLGPPQQIGMPPPSMGGMNAQPTQPYTAPHLQQRPSQPSPQAPPLSQGMGMPYPVQQRPMSTGHLPPQQQQLQPSSMPQVPGPGNHALQPAAPYPVRIPTALHEAACEVELISCCLIVQTVNSLSHFLIWMDQYIFCYMTA